MHQIKAKRLQQEMDTRNQLDLNEFSSTSYNIYYRSEGTVCGWQRTISFNCLRLSELGVKIGHFVIELRLLPFYFLPILLF